MFFVVVYDITDDRRRIKIHKTLKDYGEPVQKSVFEFNAPKSIFQEMLKRSERFLRLDTDSFRVYVICEECRSRTLVVSGKPTVEEDIFFMV